MKILLVEDEHKIAQALKTGLERENYIVDVRFDGLEGYDMASSEEYDLILLDRLLPGMDGLTLCKKLREKNNHTPVLMLTAKGEVGDKVEGLDTGADDYLVKPFAFSELISRVRAITRRPKTLIHALLQVDDLVLDTKSYKVTRNKQVVDLSNKEYALLEYLMRHAEQTLSKEQIIAHVWDYDADVLPNSVEVYIKHLRDKIHDLGTPLIFTVRGFGYKICSRLHESS